MIRAYLADILGLQKVHAPIVTRIRTVRKHIHHLNTRLTLTGHRYHLLRRHLPVRYRCAGHYTPCFDPLSPAADCARRHVCFAWRHLIDGVCEVAHVADWVEVGDWPVWGCGEGHLDAAILLLLNASD